jgi:CheY-like chemotaxis protein
MNDAPVMPLRRIMCVEDDPDIRLILEFSLQSVGGWEICLCASGEEALQQAPRFMPQLILMDVMMPKMDGPQTLAELRKVNGGTETQVIFLTAKSLQDDLLPLFELGVLGVIVKPFDPMRLPSDIALYWSRGVVHDD